MSQALIDKTLFTFTSWNTHIISFHTKIESLKQFSLVKTIKKKKYVPFAGILLSVENASRS